MHVPLYVSFSSHGSYNFFSFQWCCLISHEFGKTHAGGPPMLQLPARPRSRTLFPDLEGPTTMHQPPGPFPLCQTDRCCTTQALGSRPPINRCEKNKRLERTFLPNLMCCSTYEECGPLELRELRETQHTQYLLPSTCRSQTLRQRLQA